VQWRDVLRPPKDQLLRQFAGLTLVVFGGLVVWRLLHGQTGLATVFLAVFAVVIGGVGLAWPSAIRPVYQAWMIVAFPIGWLVSNAILAVMFFAIFTPMAAVFRLIGRDALLRRNRGSRSYWVPSRGPADPREYFRQS